MAESIEKLLSPRILQEEAVDVRSMLAMLIGKLNVHLAMEDEVLYPRLLNHKEESIRDKALKLQEEVGHIKQSFQSFGVRWPGYDPIKSAPGEFRNDVRNLLTQLRQRIAREDSELFPLVES